MSPEAQAVYAELNSRRGILDGIDDELIEEICTAVADAVMAAHEVGVYEIDGFDGWSTTVVVSKTWKPLGQ